MVIIGISGGSGSGKTTFAKRIVDRVNSPRVGVLHQDSYYLPSPPNHLKVDGKGNFDHPEAFDWVLLKEHVKVLKSGGRINVPVYDYKINRRASTQVSLGPCDVLVFEGIFALWDEELRKLFDLKIFLHVDADIRFIRRLHRDVMERGRNIDGIIKQYYDTVRPMHNQYLEPTQRHADLVVGEETEIGANVIAAHVQEVLRNL